MPNFDRAFDFLHHNERPEKPRERGITEIRGPYYDPMGPRELRDILETMGWYVDIYKVPRVNVGDIMEKRSQNVRRVGTTLSGHGLYT